MRRFISVSAGMVLGVLCGSGAVRAQAPAAAPAAPQVPAKVAATGGTNEVTAAQALRITGPLVAKPPPYARWTVRMAWAETEGKAGGSGASNKKGLAAPVGPRMIEYVKGPNVGRQTTTWSNGGQTIIWFYDRIMMEKFPVDAPILLKELPPAGRREEGVIGDFSTDRFIDKYIGFEWLKPEFFVGEENKNGLLCLHFKESVPEAKIEVKLSADDVAHYDEMDRVAAEDAKAAGQKGPPKRMPRTAPDRLEVRHIGFDREAWVTVEGRWPVALQEGSVVTLYQHQEPPTQGTFPRMAPEFETVLVEYCQAWNLPAPKY